MSFNLPNPCLIGILLVVSTHSGPQLVFKYPPDIVNSLKKKKAFEDVSNNDSQYGASNDDDEQSSGDKSYSDDDWNVENMNFYVGTKKDIISFLDDQERRRHKPKDRNTSDYKHSVSSSPSTDSASIAQKVSSNTSDKQPESTMTDSGMSSGTLKKTHSGVSGSRRSSASRKSIKGHTSDYMKSLILGYEPDYLSEMLCPPRQMCNSRFEIMIDDLIFLGLPIHSFEDGSWRQSDSKRVASRISSKIKYKSQEDDKSKKSSNENNAQDNPPAADSKNSLNMFHLVFIMNPPIIESNYRIDEMFHYVISRLSLVLRYEQSKHDYIWSQVRLIAQIREDFRSMNTTEEFHNFLVERSSLCKLIADCYEQISKSNIANLSINKKLRSFQIPIKTEFSSLPEPTLPYIPGSNLSSTVNILANTGLVSIGETTRYGLNSLDPVTSYSSKFALDNNGAFIDQDFIDEETDDNAEDIVYYALLLLDEPESIIKDIKTQPQSPLALFIRMIRPSESLLKLSNKIKTQKKNNLDLDQIKSFAFHLIYWRRARVILPLNPRSVYIVSPMAPLTIRLYEDISKFKDMFPTMPSLPHFLALLSSPSKKPRQFASIIPSKDHKDIYLLALAWLIRHGYVTQLLTFIWLKVSKKVKIKVEEDFENEGLDANKKNKSTESKIEKRINSGTDNTSKLNSNKAQSDSTRKNLVSNIDEHKNHIDNGNLSKNLFYSIGAYIGLEEDEETIITDPGRATTLERRWINKIISEECKLSPDLVVIFYKLLKYMNGKTSLENLLLKGNISRSELRKLLFAIEDHIISVRHW
ncbi:Piso0_000054 [Millerozyma farinosa CBS 7064]|uniref:Nitrogen permease regulator 3 n=1 Tax=Pichia sorbitophila (strain ATCC MYA-4447 / BCRC 22081 / CBS 7064 / NBRC 10061 / NRRL Y-12695) TaxID=559304 RepID=G8YSZ2_PICSO|nr:Piso0_000054 [Millerozyma farinosa CBS 7064]